MSRSLSTACRFVAATAVGLVLHVPAATAQVAARRVALPLGEAAVVTPGELTGVVLDEGTRPLAGVVVSALGSTTAFAVSDKDGRFLFRSLPPGPYLVRAHLQGYQPARARILQVSVGSKRTSTITMTKRGEGQNPPAVLSAGVGATATTEAASDGETTHEHGELAWRLRHLKRSVLKDAMSGFEPAETAAMQPAASRWRESLAGLGYAVDGQVNLLTSASLEHPQDLLTTDASMLRGVALMSFEAPGTNGQWRMRGALTQGDLSSWLVAGSYVRTTPSAHEYEGGFSYGMQRYLGSNAATLTSMGHDSRAVGTVYAYDTWTPRRGIRVGYGSEYATHDYLGDDSLLSPRVSLAVQPFRADSFKVRATAFRRETAPGAEEFVPPSAGVWLPPERTFSTVSTSGTFRPERIDDVELAVERTMPGDVLVGVRTFRQRGHDQVVAFFGAGPAGPAGPAASTGHYYVGSAGDFEATGWGLRVSRTVGDVVRASVDYTQAGATWSARSADRGALTRMASAAVRDVDRLHDVTASLESTWAPTSTRVFVLYKVNTALTAADPESDQALVGTRFDVQISQGLPFLRFTNTRWEALVAVRNMFHDDTLNGSVYDELLVVRPPTRVLGGVTVKF